jgi:hypothetical protein
MTKSKHKRIWDGTWRQAREVERQDRAVCIGLRQEKTQGQIMERVIIVRCSGGLGLARI